MSIPLDRLYNFVDSLGGHDIVIYRFSPHGSKNITDLTRLRDASPAQFLSAPRMICHDQEPLNHALYSDPAVITELINNQPTHFLSHYNTALIPWLTTKNLKLNTDPGCCNGDRVLLLHSEKHSDQLDLYRKSGFVPVYWWSHAIIARDWFRYAEHDPDLKTKHIHRDFLIYNRAWQGTREYRLKFAELVIDYSLSSGCGMRFNPWDSGQYYGDHQYANPAFRVTTALEDHFDLNTHDATASADYASSDYQHTGIEVVLETLFDDARWHLTEKTLRPMACAQPFILAATPGSLAYVKQYGFQTFAPLIDETYDTIADPGTRLMAIVEEMRRIANLPQDQKLQLFEALHGIALQNQQRFFSDDFYRQVILELETNLAQARVNL